MKATLLPNLKNTIKSKENQYLKSILKRNIDEVTDIPKVPLSLPNFWLGFELYALRRLLSGDVHFPTKIDPKYKICNNIMPRLSSAQSIVI